MGVLLRANYRHQVIHLQVEAVAVNIVQGFQLFYDSIGPRATDSSLTGETLPKGKPEIGTTTPEIWKQNHAKKEAPLAILKEGSLMPNHPWETEFHFKPYTDNSRSS